MDVQKLKITFIVVLLLVLTTSAQAQTALSLSTPVTGTIGAGETNVWTFSAQNSAILSFALQSETDGFDPAITLTDGSGNQIISSDDYNYPDSFDPLLEAVTMPRADTFRVTVSGVNNTAGDYTLTMLPGYGVPAYNDDFSENEWQPLNDVITAEQIDEQLSLAITSARQFGVAFDSSAESFGDFYAQAEVTSVNNPSGWVVGMAFRRQGDSYYLLSVNAQGSWRFSIVEEGVERIIRDWTPHPNIVPSATRFSIAVLAREFGFDFFFNTGYIGSASDTTLTDTGAIGLMVSTISSQPSTTSATFDDLVVTTPVQVGDGYVVPQQIYGADSTALVQTLRRKHMVSAAGQMAVTIPESSVQFARPGINRIMFGNGTQYSNFALGATVDLTAGVRGPAGCGIVFRFTGETEYDLAYFNQDGEYGISRRSGDTFSAGISGANSRFTGTQHQVLMIANEDMLYYYIDNQLVGTLEDPPQDGQIGIAVVNFENNTTSCTYTNFWLWNWD